MFPELSGPTIGTGIIERHANAAFQSYRNAFSQRDRRGGADAQSRSHLGRPRSRGGHYREAITMSKAVRQMKPSIGRSQGELDAGLFAS